ncbi:hypothetical protein [Nocardiopsis alba]|uniref:hypothetical protein n=1 Tax=Nocardiopsis alba TaxID=53437 RepID=UPI0033A747B7
MPRPAIALDRRIARLREIAEAEPRLEGVLLYGSWTQGEADEYSDIEAYLYVADEHAASFDGTEFVSRLAPARTGLHQPVRHPGRGLRRPHAR